MIYKTIIMMNILFVGLGGFFGSAARFFLSSQIARINGTAFPFGTFFVNIAGSFLIGFFFTIFEERFFGADYYKNFITAGFLGGFTTFSSFAMENISLLKKGEIIFFILNFTLTNIIGLLAVTAGIFTAGFLFKKNFLK